ncbi:MAG: electron transfer flavoprotein beta subunit/FixA family protein, partial [Clostridia bacterium]|nr:electron transfer flavoprotein beta subunit/FixA family protein [Clostridia bacterium]
MPDVVVCYKWVVDERDIRVEKGELVFDRVGYKISDYDRNAIEEAVRIKEALGGTVTAVTVGPSSAQASVKDALQRGPDSLYFVAYEGELDSEATSLILSRVVNKLNFDLIILGEGSADVYAQQ